MGKYFFISFIILKVVAHEISHSWTGNLVTNVNWEHFWLINSYYDFPQANCTFVCRLNEGFTRYLERLIVLELHGDIESTLQLKRMCTNIAL